jgi:hypothetical protein
MILNKLSKLLSAKNTSGEGAANVFLESHVGAGGAQEAKAQF